VRGNLLGRSSLAVAVVLASASLALPASAAVSSSVVHRGGDIVQFIGPSDRSIHLTVSVNGAGLITFQEPNGPIDAGRGCTSVSAHLATCGPNKARVVVRATPLDDFVGVPSRVRGGVQVDGFGGNDLFVGGPGSETLRGGLGADDLSGQGGNDILMGGEGDDRVLGETGADTLSGGDGNDVIQGSSGADTMNEGTPSAESETGSDQISGGNGIDVVTYAERHTAVDVSANDIPDDGRAGENDNVHSDVENIVGGPFDDELIGNEYDNRVLGGDGNDTLVGGRGKDAVLGMRGDDTLDTEDGKSDRGICGDGNDTANADVKDHTSACETVNAS
jgi:RTX calcium-binding nonapeptide repeat (4 copies)